MNPSSIYVISGCVIACSVKCLTFSVALFLNACRSDSKSRSYTVVIPTHVATYCSFYDEYSTKDSNLWLRFEKKTIYKPLFFLVVNNNDANMATVMEHRDAKG